MKQDDVFIQLNKKHVTSEVACAKSLFSLYFIHGDSMVPLRQQLTAIGAFGALHIFLRRLRCFHAIQDLVLEQLDTKLNTQPTTYGICLKKRKTQQSEIRRSTKPTFSEGRRGTVGEL